MIRVDFLPRFLQVQKKPDKFNEELLSDVTEENDTGFWKSLTRYRYMGLQCCDGEVKCFDGPWKLIKFDPVCPAFRGFTGGAKIDEPKQDKDDVINIFSVASGHLYERFLR